MFDASISRRPHWTLLICFMVSFAVPTEPHCFTYMETR